MALTKVSRGLLSTGIVDNSNATAITIDSSENVGIGTNSPSSYFSGATNLVLSGTGDSGLTINSGTSNVGRIHFADGTSGTDKYRGYIVYQHAEDSMQFATGGVEGMRITSAGSVGIGTGVAPGVNGTGLAIFDALYPRLTFRNDTTGDSSAVTVGTAAYLVGDNFYLNNQEAGFLSFGTAGSERMRIDSIGNLLLGSTASAGGARLEVTENSGNLVYFKNSSGTGLYMAAGGTAWISASDERIKDIIEPISGAMAKLSTLRTVIGKYKTDNQGVRRPFLIAQDLQAVFPEVVNEQEDELKTLGVEYSSLVPLLIAGMKEQQAIIESQAASITDLTTRLTALENN